MNYYIQGDAANADRIKAAFKEKGYDVTGLDMCNNNILFFTYKLQGGGKVISTTNSNLYTADLIKTHPGYKELELPKPHYDISNFHAGMPVLVRDDRQEKWCYALYSHNDNEDSYQFVTAGGAPFIQCIPFEGNEHLLGTSDMCGEEFINW